MYNEKGFMKAFEMDFYYIQYCQYLISSHKNYTITNLANHIQRVSHYQINRPTKKILI